MNPKLGIVLQAFALTSFSGGYVPPSYYRRQGTYQRNPYEGRPKQRSDSPINTAALPATHAGVGAPSGGGPCAGVNTTITTTGLTTWTAPCTGTVTMSTWGAGVGSGYGGAAFAKSGISVTNGQVWNTYVGLSQAYASNGYPTFVCPKLSTNCTRAAMIAVGYKCNTPAGLSTSNLVCAAGAANGSGGAAANSVGITKFNGGAGGNGGGLGGGGSAGPDGAGQSFSGATGGAGDNGLGGAGGTSGNNGSSNPLGGGGAGGGGTPHQGGDPGGGAGGKYGARGGNGQIVIHGALTLPEQGRIKVADVSYGGAGTVSMS